MSVLHERPTVAAPGEGEVVETDQKHTVRKVGVGAVAIVALLGTTFGVSSKLRGDQDKKHNDAVIKTLDTTIATDKANLDAAKKDPKAILDLVSRAVKGMSNPRTAPDGRTIVTVSSDPKDANACHADFYLDSTDEDLYLPSATDASGANLGQTPIKDATSEGIAMRTIYQQSLVVQKCVLPAEYQLAK